MLSFGQNAPRSEKQRSIDAAESKARITSQALIRQFAGEIGAVMETVDQAESLRLLLTGWKIILLMKITTKKLKSVQKHCDIGHEDRKAMECKSSCDR